MKIFLLWSQARHIEELSGVFKTKKGAKQFAKELELGNSFNIQEIGLMD